MKDDKKINFGSYKKAVSFFIMSLIFFLFSDVLFAQNFGGIPALTLSKTASGEQYTLSFQILVFMTLLSFLPALILMMTSFTRIIVVFAILRQAIGLQQTPSNQVLVGLALFLSFFVMTPVLDEANKNAIQPYLENKISDQEALEKIITPFLL